MITHDQVPEELAGLAFRLPYWLLDLDLLQEIHSRCIGISIEATAILTHQAEELGGVDRIRGVFRSCQIENDWKRLTDRLVNWAAADADVPVKRIAFPPQPFANTVCLQALISRRQVKTEGKRQKNCAASLIDTILSGRGYLYHWSEEEEATLYLAREPEQANRWSIEAIHIYDNGKANDDTVSKIVDAVTAGLGARLCRGKWTPAEVSRKLKFGPGNEFLPHTSLSL